MPANIDPRPGVPPTVVKVPLDYRARGGDLSSILKAIQDEFRPILADATGKAGARVVYLVKYEDHRIVQGQVESVLILFPKDSDRAGQERFDFLDRGDGVLYGYPVPSLDAVPDPADELVEPVTPPVVL